MKLLKLLLKFTSKAKRCGSFMMRLASLIMVASASSRDGRSSGGTFGVTAAAVSGVMNPGEPDGHAEVGSGATGPDCAKRFVGGAVIAIAVKQAARTTAA
jgi:hypothetical protein